MFPSRKLTFGLIFGLAAGLVFSLAAWGLNAFLLSRAHFAFPWLTFLLGILPTMLVTGLAGFLTIRFDNAVVGALIWMVAGLFLAIIGVWLPLGLVPEILPRIEPVLNGWLEFTWIDAYSFLVYSAMITTGIAFLITGILENVLIEPASFSPYNGAIVMPILVCALISGIAGGVIDNLVNTRFRDPTIVLDQLFSYALDNQGKTIDPATERQMHLATVSPIQADLSDNRRLFYFSFNETAEEGKILVDLKGHWAICDLSQNQPVFCQFTEPPQ